MKEVLEKVFKKTKKWVVKHRSLILIGGEAVVGGCLYKKNMRLQKQNSCLRGQLSACERANERLVRESSNLSFHLGKLVAKTQQH